MPITPARRGRRLLVAATVTLTVLATGTLAHAAAPTARDAADGAALRLDALGTYDSGVFDESAAEIVAFHAATARTFVVNAQSGQVDVLDAADPTAPTLIGSVGAAGNGGIPAGAVANSVAVRADGLVVVTIESPVKTDDGWLFFLDALTLAPLGTVQVGALPDMVALTPQGTQAVVANEGEPADDYSVDPEGSISVVNLPSILAAPSQEAVSTATFHEFEEGGSRTLREGVRIFGPDVNDGVRPVSHNLEPEYVAISDDGAKAYVVLQENNAVAVVDLATATVTDIWPLGSKDHSLPGHGLDVSDRDGVVNIATWPIRGLYMPDGLNAYEAGGATYLVTANEGDAREWGDYAEAVRVSGLGRNGIPPICDDAPAAGLTSAAQLGRLNVSIASGLNADGTCFEELHAFGSRSFSIWTADGTQVFDSGDDFEQTVARVVPEYFNSNHSASNLEGRSDDKGPEPENLAIGQVGDRTYAFIGLERVGGVMVYDITVPAEAAYVTYVNRRDFSISVADEIEAADDPAALLRDAGDLGPEGLTFVPATDSPTGEAMVIVGSEVSGTTTFWNVADLEAPDPAPLALTLDAASVPVGGTVTGSLTGAAAGEELTLTLGEVALGTVTAGADGTASFSVVLPDSVAPGAYELRVTGVSGTATAALTVTTVTGTDGGTGSTPVVSAAERGVLPDAGTDVAPWLLALAAGLISGGTWLVRRRRGAHAT